MAHFLCAECQLYAYVHREDFTHLLDGGNAVADIVHWISEDTIEDLCRRGEIPTVKVGRTVLIPTISLRLKYPQLPVEFWEEITEDIYREWDGPTSSRKRLERRKQGLSPTTGEPLDKQKVLKG